MSMTQPLEPDLPRRDGGIPAADAGTGAPPPAEGFGVGGEEPDAPEQSTGSADAGTPGGGAEAAMPADTPFRTPDPTEVGPDVGRPAGPSGPDAGRTGRDLRHGDD